MSADGDLLHLARSRRLEQLAADVQNVERLCVDGGREFVLAASVNYVGACGVVWERGHASIECRRLRGRDCGGRNQALGCGEFLRIEVLPVAMVAGAGRWLAGFGCDRVCEGDGRQTEEQSP